MEIAVSIFFVCGGLGVFIFGISAMWFGWQEHRARKDAHEEAMFNILLDSIMLFKEDVDIKREDDSME